MKNLITILILIAVSMLAHSQHKPIPPPELLAFDAFVGEWSGEMGLGPAGPQQMKGIATLKFEKILDGLYIQMTLTHDLPGVGVVRGHTIYAWDPKEKKIRSHTFANGGMSDPSRPRSETGELLAGKLVMSSDGYKPAYVQTLYIQQDGTMKFGFQMDMHGNGKLSDIGGGILRKKR